MYEEGIMTNDDNLGSSLSSNRILEYMFHALWTNCPFGNRAHNLSTLVM